MAIAPRSTRTAEAAADAFISGAPDASRPQSSKVTKRIGNKVIITLSIDPTLLSELDTWREARCLSRAAAVTLAIRLLRNSAGALAPFFPETTE